MSGTKTDKLGDEELIGKINLDLDTVHNTKTYFGVFVLREFLIFALQFHSNLIPFFWPTILHDRLHYPTCIMLEHDVYNLPPNDVHE